MKTNRLRYERLHYLFSTFRRDQLEAFRDVLDASQWLEFMQLYRDMAIDSEKEVEEESSPTGAETLSTMLARRA